MINTYWFDNQLRGYLIQFCNIFTGLRVKTGVGDECDASDGFITVPVRIGSKDRVVAAIEAGNTQNKPFSLPSLAVHMTNLEMASVRHGVGVQDNRTFLPKGGVYPDDLKVATRIMPIPYTMTLEVTMYVSSAQQRDQILEQILILFDPILQIQTSDAALDWRKLTTVELTGLTNEENYPPAGDRRIIMWTLTFSIPIHITAPIDVKRNAVKEIILRLWDKDNFHPEEIQPDGSTGPYVPDFGGFKVTADGVVPMQYSLGTVAVSSGSNSLVGTGTSWISKVEAGDMLQIQGYENVYYVASVLSDTGLTLTTNYVGADDPAARYTVTKNFTPIAPAG